MVDTNVPSHLRRITLLEAAAIQTFPGDYKFIGETTSVYRQIGNAVPCNLAEAVAKAVMAVLQKTQTEKISTKNRIVYGEQLSQLHSI